MSTRRRQVPLSVLDQMAASAVNVLLALFMAHELSPGAFGTFSLVAIAYALVVSFNRVLCSEPVTVMSGNGTLSGRQVGLLSLVSAGTGALAAVLLAVFFVLAGLTVGRESVVFAAALPLLSVQSFLRMKAIAFLRADLSALANGLWLVAVVVAVPVALTSDSPAPAMMVVWSVAGVLSALMLVRTPGVDSARQDPSQGVWHFLALGSIPAIDYVVVVGASQSVFFIAASLLGPAAVSGPRLALMLLGPITVVAAGVMQGLMPQFARRPEAMRRSVPRAQLSLALMAVACGGLLLLIPDSLARLLTGQQWEATRQALPAMTLYCACVVAGMPAIVEIRIRRMNKMLLRLRLLAVPVGPLAAVVASKNRGADAVAWVAVLAVAADLATVLWAVRRARGEAGRSWEEPRVVTEPPSA